MNKKEAYKGDIVLVKAGVFKGVVEWVKQNSMKWTEHITSKTL